MRSKLWLAALPALLLGVAACDDQTAQNNANPGATSTAERPAGAPPAGGAPMPPAGTPGQNASGVNAPTATPAPGGATSGGAAGGGGNTSSQ